MRLRICLLDCDTPVPNVYAERGLYSDMIADLLENARLTEPGLEHLSLEFSKYDSVRGEYPSSNQLNSLDALIITGSSASAYDDAPWIATLTDFIRELYIERPNIKIFGTCFGHQLLANALFSTPSESVVQRDPKGWELGVQPITLTPAFLSRFGPVTSNPSSPSQLRLQFVHADHVVLHPMPEGFHAIGSSHHCALQGMWQDGRVLTYQGHAEFDRFVNRQTIKIFGKRWEKNFLSRALEMVEEEDDAIWATGIILRFFSEAKSESIDVADEANAGTEVIARL